LDNYSLSAPAIATLIRICLLEYDTHVHPRPLYDPKGARMKNYD